MLSLNQMKCHVGSAALLSWNIGNTANMANELCETVHIKTGDVELIGDLKLPASATGLVIFAHGSGSSRHSSRNKYVASLINDYQCGTLLIDLLSAKEEKIDQYTQEYRFDIEMLADRLVEITEWVAEQAWAGSLKLGYFGSSTGGGAAVMAAAMSPDNIAAVVSRGGRPDLADRFLGHVKAPTLLIVGEHDPQVILLNAEARDKLLAHTELDIVEGASHLFEEPGSLDMVAHKAAAWFSKYFQ